MNRRLTRRHFARLAVAGGVAATSFGAVALPTATIGFARSPYAGLLGISRGPRQTGGSDVPEVNHTQVEPPGSRVQAPSSPLALNVLALNLSNGTARSLAGPLTGLRSNESLTGTAVLADGTVVVAATPELTSARAPSPTHLVELGTASRSTTVSGLADDEQLGDLLATLDGRLLGIVSRRSGAAPARLVSVDLQTGRLTMLDVLQQPGYWRFATLAQSSSGQLQASAVTRQGETHLVALGQGSAPMTLLARLSLQGQAWNNGLQNLVYSSAGDLIAFGSMRYDTINGVYVVDRASGEMSRLFDASVMSVAFSHA
jgi:hypothetical protein